MSNQSAIPPPLGRLQNRIAIVTGSSSGLGAAISIAFASHGAKVFCVDLHPSPRNPAISSPSSPVQASEPTTRITTSRGTHEIIRQSGGEAIFHRADVTSSRDMQMAIRSCVRAYGRLDIMCCNAGISVESSHPRALKIHETSDEDYDRTMLANAKSVFLGCKYALKQIVEQPQLYPSARGWIVNTASVQGLVPYYGTSSYCASKGAVVMLTKQIALDYAGLKVHCNALCPGFLRTGMTVNLQADEEMLREIGEKHPFTERLVEVEEVAKAAVFLASDDVGIITGVALPVDAGYMLR